MLLNCPTCGKKISDRAPACPFCKTPRAAEKQPSTSPPGTPSDTGRSAVGATAGESTPHAAEGAPVLPEPTSPPQESHSGDAAVPHSHSALARARELAAAGDLDGAIAAVDQALTADPAFPEAWSFKAELLESLERYSEAVHACQQVTAYEKSDRNRMAEALYREGECLRHLGRQSEARDVYDRALAIIPDHHGALAALVETQRALATTVDHPTNVKDWCDRGLELHRQKRHAEALECYDQALAVDATYALAWSRKGDCLNALRRTEEAEECFRQAVALEPNKTTFWQRHAIALDVLGRHEDAQLAWEEALTIDASDASLWNGYGQCFLALGRASDALNAFDHALTIDPDYHYAYFGKAQAEERLSLKTEAERSYQQFLGVVPPDLKDLIDRARKRIQALRSS